MLNFTDGLIACFIPVTTWVAYLRFTVFNNCECMPYDPCKQFSSINTSCRRYKLSTNLIPLYSLFVLIEPTLIEYSIRIWKTTARLKTQHPPINCVQNSQPI